MNVDVIWESALLVAAGILILRIAGRKSISQMSLAQTVVMISIGSIIIQPIIEDSLWNTAAATLVFVLMLVFIEYLQLKFNRVERFVTGKAKVVIDNGVPQYETLSKMRFTVDSLEMRLRQQGIARISDVKTATLEPNGQLGYDLIDDAKPLTVGQFKEMMDGRIVMPRESGGEPDVFEEVKKNRHQLPNADNLR